MADRAETAGSDAAGASDEATRIRAIVRVHGRVQGVGFRRAVFGGAMRHAVSGTVRNDGPTLLIDVEGPRRDVERFLDWVRAHPPAGARVDRVERTDAVPTGRRAFTIAGTRN